MHSEEYNQLLSMYYELLNENAELKVKYYELKDYADDLERENDEYFNFMMIEQEMKDWCEE